jgi:hypothetical protein
LIGVFGVVVFGIGICGVGNFGGNLTLEFHLGIMVEPFEE